ncbi:hypothetical protein D3C79_954330 [compost metagenome]
MNLRGIEEERQQVGRGVFVVAAPAKGEDAGFVGWLTVLFGLRKQSASMLQIHGIGPL